MIRRLLHIFLCLFAFQVNAQDSATVKVMHYDDFIQRVKNHHPMARQAQIIEELGEAYFLKSKGGFDPVIHGNINQKYFKDEQYYSIANAGLKIPTWYGISFQGGYDLTTGSQLNPERSLPDDGLWYAGVNIALGKGLIIDQRRAEYKKAKIYLESSIQRRIQLMNELCLQASVAYWEWFKSYNKMLVYQDAVDNAYDRFVAVRESALLGDDPFIDTLEANIQLQNRLFNYLDAELAYENASVLLEMYLWDDGIIPVELDSNTIPPKSESVIYTNIDPTLALMVDSLQVFHPDLMTTQYKIEQNKVDLQLSRENLKPELNFKYNALAEPVNGDVFNNYSIHNYVWGADLKFPIILRKERGELKIAKLQIENMENELAFKSKQLQFKINTSLNTWTNTYEQLQIWSRTTQDYLTLLESERLLFNIGESSLFMVNSREKAYISAQLQLIDKISDNRKAEVKTKYALGIIYQN